MTGCGLWCIQAHRLRAMAEAERLRVLELHRKRLAQVHALAEGGRGQGGPACSPTETEPATTRHMSTTWHRACDHMAHVAMQVQREGEAKQAELRRALETQEAAAQAAIAVAARQVTTLPYLTLPYSWSRVSDLRAPAPPRPADGVHTCSCPHMLMPTCLRGSCHTGTGGAHPRVPRQAHEAAHRRGAYQ